MQCLSQTSLLEWDLLPVPAACGQFSEPPEQDFNWAGGEHTLNVWCALQGNGGDSDIGGGGGGGTASGQGAQALGGGQLHGHFAHGTLLKILCLAHAMHGS